MAEDDERRSYRSKSGRRETARGPRPVPQVIEGQAEQVTDPLWSEGSDPVGAEDSEPASDLLTPSEPLAAHAGPTPTSSDLHETPTFAEPHGAPVSHPEPVTPLGLSAIVDPELEMSHATDEPVAALSPEAPPAGFGSPPPGSFASSPPPFRAEPLEERSNLIPALLGLGLLLLFVAVIYLFYDKSNDYAALSGTVSGLETKVSELEARPVPTPPDLSGIDQKLAGDAAAMATLKADLATLNTRVGAVSTAKPTPAPTPAPDIGPQFAAVDQKIAAVDQKIAAVQHDLDALRTTVRELPKPDFGPVNGRIGEVDKHLGVLQTTVDKLPRVDLAPVFSQLHELDGRLKPVESDVAASQSPQRVAQAKAAPLAVAAQAVLDALAANRPFAPEVGALQSLGADAARLEPLRAVAGDGAPALADLQADLGRLRDSIVAEGTPPPKGSYMDRIMAGAGALVQVKPVGTVVGDTPGALVARMDAAIGADALGDALALWQKLPEGSRTVSKTLAARIKLRLDAEVAAKAIAADAVSAMAPKG